MDLEILNSVTKYPSIETYHTLGEKGRLTDEVTRFDGVVYGYEKVDGTNGRIVLTPDGDYFIGSREELLYAKGDRVIPSSGINHDIVAELRQVADDLLVTNRGSAVPRTGVTVLYLEVYGSKIGGQAKQYTDGTSRGHRLFDVMHADERPFEWDRETISRWRSSGGQQFATIPELNGFAREHGIVQVPLLGTLADWEMPRTLVETYEHLGNTIPETRVPLDRTAKGAPEGIVFRNQNRSIIRKARFADYRRTLNIK